MVGFALREFFEKTAGEQRSHLYGPGRKCGNPGGHEPEQPLNIIERSGIAIRQQQTARDGIESLQIVQKRSHYLRILALPVVQKDVPAKVRIAADRKSTRLNSSH